MSNGHPCAPGARHNLRQSSSPHDKPAICRLKATQRTQAALKTRTSVTSSGVRGHLGDKASHQGIDVQLCNALRLPWVMQLANHRCDSRRFKCELNVPEVRDQRDPPILPCFANDRLLNTSSANPAMTAQGCRARRIVSM